MLQHAETLLPMAGEIQADLNSHTGVSGSYTWGLMLPSSSRVSPITYHSVVAVRYPDLCRIINGRSNLINGLVAADMDTLVSRVLTSFPTNRTNRPTYS